MQDLSELVGRPVGGDILGKPRRLGLKKVLRNTLAGKPSAKERKKDHPSVMIEGFGGVKKKYHCNETRVM